MCDFNLRLSLDLCIYFDSVFDCLAVFFGGVIVCLC